MAVPVLPVPGRRWWHRGCRVAVPTRGKAHPGARVRITAPRQRAPRDTGREDEDVPGEVRAPRRWPSGAGRWDRDARLPQPVGGPGRVGAVPRQGSLQGPWGEGGVPAPVGHRGSSAPQGRGLRLPGGLVPPVTVGCLWVWGVPGGPCSSHPHSPPRAGAGQVGAVCLVGRERALSGCSLICGTARLQVGCLGPCWGLVGCSRCWFGLLVVSGPAPAQFQGGFGTSWFLVQLICGSS